jgi:AAA domain/IS1 transposase
LVRREVPSREDAGECRKGIPDLVIKFIHEHGHADQFATAVLNQLTGRLRLAAVLDPVVDQQHSISGLYGLLLNLKDMAHTSIVECRFDSMFGTGKQVAFFANRDEAHSEPVRSRASQDESASLDAADLRHVLRSPGADQCGNNLGKGLTGSEDPPDIGVPSLPCESTKERFRACLRSRTHTNSMLVQRNTAHAKVASGSCSIEMRVIAGNPEMEKISTSYVERQNLTMRVGMRRFTRLTNAFSKKVENHAHAISVHFTHYNFCQPHQTLTKKAGKRTTPAMAAGIAIYPWSLTQLAELLDLDAVREARLILTCGLPGAGKTALATQLAADRGAVRLTKDEWLTALGSSPWDEPTRVKIEQELWNLAQESLRLATRPFPIASSTRGPSASRASRT